MMLLERDDGWQALPPSAAVEFARRPHDAGASVSLWSARLGGGHRPAMAWADAELLGDEERARALRFLRDSDRAQFVVGWTLVRRSLSRYADVEPCEWQFERSPHGKPRIHRRFDSRLEFSLSHSHGVCLVAIASGGAVGVDVERADSDAPTDALAGRCLSPAERRSLDELPEAARPGRFFELWTRKEAYAKARGLGLSLPFEEICTASGLRLGPRIADDPRRWTCGSATAPTGFRAALCARVCE